LPRVQKRTLSFSRPETSIKLFLGHFARPGNGNSSATCKTPAPSLQTRPVTTEKYCSRHPLCSKLVFAQLAPMRRKAGKLTGVSESSRPSSLPHVPSLEIKPARAAMLLIAL